MEHMEISLSKSFDGIYHGKRVLITGHTGFKGSWLSIWLKALGAEVFGYALAPTSSKDNFVRCRLDSKIQHREGDVRNLTDFTNCIQSVQPDCIFHLAAQPLVLNSYQNPHYNFETNLMGTVNLFEAVRSVAGIQCVINVTTDKCYLNQEWLWGYRENEPLGGEDPYSASKACSELITHAYRQSFFKSTTCKIASARAGNVIGGGDWAENRILPDAFRAIENQTELIIRNPNSIRPWQFVLEPLYGYLKLGMHLLKQESGFDEAWNFGPLSPEPYTVKTIIDVLKNQIPDLMVRYEESNNKPHEAGLLQLDIGKSIHRMGWKPKLSLHQTLEFTARGYLQELQNPENTYASRLNQIIEYSSL
jgi:CDP-glucose 4,6-dehydratase